jgi:Uma2 family endonuclease
MGLAAHHVISFEDYLQLEEGSPVRHEWLDGAVYAMAGGTFEHAALGAALAGLLVPQLAGGWCRAFSSELKIRCPSGLATYPDLSVFCGPVQADPAGRTVAVNPRLLVEVLSKSTEAYDLGEKFMHYAGIPSLEQVLFIGSERFHVELRERRGGWKPVRFEPAVYTRCKVMVLGHPLDVVALYQTAGLAHYLRG